MKLNKFKFKNIKAQIVVITGLHIGAANENMEIGGLDNPIIKDGTPGSHAPYVPGSSLKGKMRSLLEIKSGNYDKKGGPCKCGACDICAVFGASAAKDNDNEKEKKSTPSVTRIIVRDAYLSEKWKNRFKRGDLPMEIKYENTIDRITGAANPRPLERVPATVEFDLEISYKEFAEDPKYPEDPKSYFNIILQGLRLVQEDALGGCGSRGCGRVKFKEISIDGIKQPGNFLESISLE